MPPMPPMPPMPRMPPSGAGCGGGGPGPGTLGILIFIICWPLLYVWSFITIGACYFTGWWDAEYSGRLVDYLTFGEGVGMFLIAPLVVGGFMGMPLMMITVLVGAPMWVFIKALLD